MLQWVYRAHVSVAELSPLLIGAAVAMARMNLAARPDLRLVRAVLPAIAVLLALYDPSPIHPPVLAGAVLTPARFTFAAAYAAWVYILFFRYAKQMLAGGAVAAAACAFGPDLQQVRAVSSSACDWGLATLEQGVPKTAVQWGFVAMGSAFTFLAVGAGLSLRRQSNGDESVAGDDL